MTLNDAVFHLFSFRSLKLLCLKKKQTPTTLIQNESLLSVCGWDCRRLRCGARSRSGAGCWSEAVLIAVCAPLPSRPVPAVQRGANALR